MAHYELDFLDDYSDEALIAELVRVAASVEGPLTRRKFDGAARVSSSTVTKRFGDWLSALRRAGLETKYSGQSVTNRMRVQQGRHLTDKELLEEMRRAAVDNRLTQSDFSRSATVSVQTVRGRFGDWDTALSLAGLLPGKRLTQKIRSQAVQRATDEQIIAELRHVADLIDGATPSQPDFDEHSQMTARGVSSRMGTWSEALLTAGLAPRRKRVRRSSISDDELLENIRVVWDTNHRRPTYVDMQNQPSRIGPKVYVRRFGSWPESLQAFSRDERYVAYSLVDGDSPLRRTTARWSDEQMLAEARRVAALIGAAELSASQFNEHATIGSHSLVKRFGGWAKAMDAAGLSPSRGYRAGFTDEECFENLAAVWAHRGRRPKYSEMNKEPSKIGTGTYVNRWGSWRGAVRAFTQWAGEPSVQESYSPTSDSTLSGDESGGSLFVQAPPSHEAPPRETVTNLGGDRPDAIASNTELNAATSRASSGRISTKMRFQVFKRDKFKCVACGRSPATVVDLELHADHVIPRSQGGLAHPDNLQTLCSECNNGKGVDHSSVQRVRSGRV